MSIELHHGDQRPLPKPRGRGPRPLARRDGPVSGSLDVVADVVRELGEKPEQFGAAFFGERLEGLEVLFAQEQVVFADGRPQVFSALKDGVFSEGDAFGQRCGVGATLQGLAECGEEVREDGGDVVRHVGLQWLEMDFPFLGSREDEPKRP